MSPLETPGAVLMIATGAGAFVGFFALVGVCVLVERWRR